MLVDNLPTKDEAKAQLNSSEPNDTITLEELPPSFEQATEDRPLPDPPQQDPPPAFSTHIPSFFTDENGTIISNDPHLNEDGEALHRFLLAQSSTPPTYHLHIIGTHEKNRTCIFNSHHYRWDDHSDTKIKTETATATTEVIVDFDFRIDLTPNIIKDPAHAPVQWSVPDNEPAYRGKAYQEVEVSDTPGGETRMRKLDTKELEEYELWYKEGNRKGLPPWIRSRSRNPSASRNAPSEDGVRLRSSQTVRKWCDDYCASDRLHKEFIYTKCVYGWDFGVLKQAIETTIKQAIETTVEQAIETTAKQTSYRGTLEVEFTLFPSANDLIIVRPANDLSGLASDTWVKTLLWFTFICIKVLLGITPIDSFGGPPERSQEHRDVWKVCGGGYPLKVVLPLARDDGHQLPTSEEAAGGSSSAAIQAETYVIGEGEGEWFRKWESTIRSAVLSKTQDKNPIVHPVDGPYINPSATMLDGYRD